MKKTLKTVHVLSCNPSTTTDEEMICGEASNM